MFDSKTHALLLTEIYIKWETKKALWVYCTLNPSGDLASGDEKVYTPGMVHCEICKGCSGQVEGLCWTQEFLGKLALGRVYTEFGCLAVDFLKLVGAYVS